MIDALPLLLAALGVAVALYLLVQNARLNLRLERLERRIGGAAPAPRSEAAAPSNAEGAEEPESLGGLFERLVAGRLLIWLGGIALVLAALFLIRHSIEIGLVTPRARMIAAALFGLALLAAGEYSRSALARDLRIAQALVGAGVAVLYATAYGSYVLYGLIGLGTASAAMLAVTAAALVLSFRHGAPAAAMGLVGGFVTPILVGDPDAGALPLLAYIALLDLALFVIARRRGWTWLAAAAVALSFAWTGWLLVRPPADARAAGLFIILLSLAAALVRPGDGRELRLLQPLALGLIELSVLVARTDLGGEAWLLFGLLAAASLALAAWRAEHMPAPPLALALGLALLLAKAATGEESLTPAAAIGITGLFGGVGLALTQRRGGLYWTAIAAAGLAGPSLILRAARPELLVQPAWGLLLALLALATAALLWAERRHGSLLRGLDIARLIAGLGLAALAAAAIRDLAARDLVTAGWLLLSVVLITGGIRLPDKALRLAGLLMLTATVVKAFLLDAAGLEGVLRILSFLLLGIALIGVGLFYGPVLRAERDRR